MSEINVGDTFKRVYPFILVSEMNYDFPDGYSPSEFWIGGCKKHSEEGPAVFEGQGLMQEFHTADAEGFIEYEVLAVVEMPRKYQERVIYRISMIDPDGGVKKSSKDYTVTMNRFMGWINGNAYCHEYDVTQ